MQAELRREKETWGTVQQNNGGEPFTDDIRANPRTRMNSFLLPFTTRESKLSPERSSSTAEEPGAVRDDVDSNNVVDHTTRAAGGDDEVNFVGIVTAEEGTIGAGGLERSASRHVHETTTTTNNNNTNNNTDLEKQ